MRTDPTDTPAGCEYATVYIAFELSKGEMAARHNDAWYREDEPLPD